MIILRESRKVNSPNHLIPSMPKKSQRPSMEPGLLHRLSYCRILITIRLRQLRVTDKQIAELVAADWGETPSNSSINQIFAGMQKDITTRQARAIANAAGVDTGWLVTGEGQAPLGYVAPDPVEAKPERKRAAATFGEAETREAEEEIRRRGRPSAKKRRA